VASWRLLFVLLLSFVFFTACGRRYGELQRLDLTVPGKTNRLLNAPAAFLTGVDRLNTYSRYSDGRPDAPTTRTIVLHQTEPELYRSYDSYGNWVEFDLDLEAGLKITRGHNTAYGSWIVFHDPLLFAPSRMEQNSRFEQKTAFTTWADSWTTRTGQLAMATWFAGVEDIDTDLGRLEQCVRVDSAFTATLFFGLPFNATVNQRQWIHADYGEVVRDLDGSYGVIGLPVKAFTSRHVISASRELTEGEAHDLLTQRPRRPSTKRLR